MSSAHRIAFAVRGSSAESEAAGTRRGVKAVRFVEEEIGDEKT